MIIKYFFHSNFTELWDKFFLILQLSDFILFIGTKFSSVYLFVLIINFIFLRLLFSNLLKEVTFLLIVEFV